MSENISMENQVRHLQRIKELEARAERAEAEAAAWQRIARAVHEVFSKYRLRWDDLGDRPIAPPVWVQELDLAVDPVRYTDGTAGASLLDEVKRLRETIEFYADKGNWIFIQNGGRYTIMDDMGARARAALAPATPATTGEGTR